MVTRAVIAVLCVFTGMTFARADEACAPGPRVIRIVAEQLMVEPKEVIPSANFQTDLNADELDIVELVMAFEEEFDVAMSDEDLESIETVGGAIHYFEARVSCPAEAVQ